MSGINSPDGEVEAKVLLLKQLRGREFCFPAFSKRGDLQENSVCIVLEELRQRMMDQWG